MIKSTVGNKPGQWKPVKNGDCISAIYYCNECGNPMSLQNHQINDDGTVNPSVVCPNPIFSNNPPIPELANEDMRMPTLDCKNCNFHNYVQLIGWQHTNDEKLNQLYFKARCNHRMLYGNEEY